MMNDWNVIVSVHEPSYKRAGQLLEEFGLVGPTDFYNIYAMKVEDISHLLEMLRERMATDDAVRSSLARVMPITRSFNFQMPEEFEAKAKEAVLPWTSELADRGFHVRMHRWGFKGRLVSQQEERLLDHFLLENLEQAGTRGHITFDDPDVIIAVETINQRAGLSLWTRNDLGQYPFLRLD